MLQEEAGPGVAKQQQPLYSGAKVTSAPEAAAAKAEELGPAHAHGGSNEDMKKVLMELDNTGYFAEVRTKINVSCKLYPVQLGAEGFHRDCGGDFQAASASTNPPHWPNGLQEGF